MRILHTIQSVDPRFGGPIEGIKQLAAASPAHVRHEVLSIDAPHAPCVGEFGLPLAAVGPGGTLGYTPHLVPWLREHARGYDAVVIHGLWRYVSFGSWRALRAMQVPYFVMPHGMLDPWFKRRYPLKHVRKWMFWPWTEYRVLRDARAVIFTCEEERLRARESFWLYRCRELVNAYGINPPPPEADQQRRAFLAAYPQLSERRIVLFLGRIHPKKGCDLLIEAFAQVCHRDPRLHLVMAGPSGGRAQEALHRQARDLGIDARITWTGMLGGDLKWGALRSAEAFALTSHQENFGIAVVEAMACGVPVLLSDKVQIWREIVGDGAGYAEPDDIPGARRLLERWLDTEPAVLAAMGERGRASFEQRFAARISALRLIEFATPAPA